MENENYFISDLNCLLIGNCYKKTYDYTFIYNNVEYEADNCYKTLFDSTTCLIGKEEFKNVPYTSNLVKTEHVYTKGLLHFLCFYILLFIILYNFKRIYVYILRHRI